MNLKTKINLTGRKGGERKLEEKGGGMGK